MRKHYKVVIVGGGPAGSSAAYTLAKQGIEVCIIDKAVFPRHKLCGGLLTLRSKKIFTQVFGASWDKAFEQESQGIKFFFKEKLLNSAENYSELYFTQRIDFDHYLLNLAESKGADLYLGDAIVSIDIKDKVCSLRSGKEITYDYLIGADGVNSIVAKTIFGSAFNQKKIALALEIEVDRGKVDRLITNPEIYFGIADWGYGWIFPKKDTLTIGVGGIYVKNPHLKETFIAFAKGILGDAPVEKIKGHHIPFGDYRKKPCLGSILLAGDAAGFVDPITGEGIAFAMQSGYFAAMSIAESLNSGNDADALKTYKDKCGEISAELDYANILRNFIFPKPSEYLLVKALSKSTELPRKHMDLMAGNIKYKEYVKYLASKALKKIARRVLFLKY